MNDWRLPTINELEKIDLLLAGAYWSSLHKNTQVSVLHLPSGTRALLCSKAKAYVVVVRDTDAGLEVSNTLGVNVLEGPKTYSEALKWIKKLNHKNDWRLPNMLEAKGLEANFQFTWVNQGKLLYRGRLVQANSVMTSEGTELANVGACVAIRQNKDGTFRHIAIGKPYSTWQDCQDNLRELYLE